MMIGILITNFGNIVTEFIGIATSLELFGLPRLASVPVCGVIVWLIVVKGQYKTVEKVFLAASFFYVTYIFAGVLAHPMWKDATIATFKPPAIKRISRSGLSLHGHRSGGDDDCAVDAVLPASVDRRKGRHPAWVQGIATGRGDRLHFHGHRGMVHHRGVRGDTLCARLSATSSMRRMQRRL